MNTQEIEDKKAKSKYCKGVNKLHRLGFIGWQQSKSLVSSYLKESEEKQNLLDDESELALLPYTNGISLLKKINNSNERISKNVQFFFWVTIIVWVVALIVFIIDILMKSR